MRGDEYPIDDFSLKLDDLLASTGELTEHGEQQVRQPSYCRSFSVVRCHPSANRLISVMIWLHYCPSSRRHRLRRRDVVIIHHNLL